MHRVEPARATLHGQYSQLLNPAIVVRSGDRVAYHTLDVAWGMEAPSSESAPRRKFEPRESPRDHGPCLIGPTVVQGAEPGDVLEIRIERLVPASEGWHSAWVPRRTAGNMDCRELTEGSVLLVPVEVPGAMVSIGDGHAAQGDGEVSGTAVECAMEAVELQFVVRRDLQLDGPRALTPAGWLTFGFSELLEEAVEQAVCAMLDLMQAQFTLDRKDALALASTVVDVRITQLVNGIRGVHALLPRGALEQMEQPAIAARAARRVEEDRQVGLSTDHSGR